MKYLSDEEVFGAAPAAGETAGPEYLSDAELFGGSAETESEGSVAGDLAASWGVGSNMLLRGVGSLYGLATGNMDNAAVRQGESGMEYWAGRKSSALTGAEERRTSAIEGADGELAKFGTAIWETVKDPRLLASFVVEQAPMTIGPGAVGRAGAVGASALGAGAKTAGVVGTGGAIGAGAGLQAADVGERVYSDLLGLPAEMWEQNPDFQALAAEIGPEGAMQELALEYARGAAQASGGLSVASQAVPGGRTIERVLGGGRGGPGGIVSRVARGAIGEGAQEVIEEGGGQAIGNYALSQVDPDQQLTEGLGESAGLALVGGGVLGGAAGLPGAGADAGADPEAQAAAELERIRRRDIDAQAEAAAEQAKAEGGDALSAELARNDVYLRGEPMGGATFTPDQFQPIPSEPPEGTIDFRPYEPGMDQPVSIDPMTGREMRPLDDRMDDALPYAPPEVSRQDFSLVDLAQQGRPAGNEIEFAPQDVTNEKAAGIEALIAENEYRDIGLDAAPAEPVVEPEGYQPGPAAREEIDQAEMADLERLYEETRKNLPQREKGNQTAGNQDMDILQFIASEGGISTDEAKARGFDSGDAGKRAGGIARVFTKKGKSFDAMAERLAEEGFFDGRDYTPNELEDLVRRGLSGEMVFSSRSEKAAKAKAIQADLDRIQGAMDELQSARDEDITDPPKGRTWQAESDPVRQLGYTILEAEGVGVPRANIDRVLDSAQTPEQAEAALREEIELEKEFRGFWFGSEGQGEGRGQGDQAAPRGPEAAEEGRGAEGSTEAVAPELSLTQETEQQRAERERSEQEARDAAARQEQEAEQKAQADAERGDFTLTGSDRSADVLAAQGQGGLFEGGTDAEIPDGGTRGPADAQTDEAGGRIAGEAVLGDPEPVGEDGGAGNDTGGAAPADGAAVSGADAAADGQPALTEEDDLLGLFLDPSKAGEPEPAPSAPGLTEQQAADIAHAEWLIGEYEAAITSLQGKAYKDNKAKIQSGDAETDRGEFRGGAIIKTIGEINESKRKRAIRDFRSQVDSLKRLKGRIASGSASLKEMQDYYRDQGIPSLAWMYDPRSQSMIVTKDGIPFKTEAAAKIARGRKDLQGRVLTPVQVDGGWALQESGDSVAATKSPDAEAKPASSQQFNFSAVIRNAAGDPFHVNSRRGTRANIAPFENGRPSIHNMNPTVEMDGYTFSDEWWSDGKITQGRAPEPTGAAPAQGGATEAQAQPQAPQKSGKQKAEGSKGGAEGQAETKTDRQYIIDNFDAIVRDLIAEGRKEIDAAAKRKTKKTPDAVKARERVAEKHGLTATGFDEADIILGKALMPIMNMSGAMGGDSASIQERLSAIEGELAKALGLERASTAQPEPEAPIEDFGEKIEGARKDYASKLESAKEKDTASVSLSESWPEPDYQKLLESGVSEDAAALVHAIRDEVPPKPRKAWKLKGWVEQVETMRGWASDLMDGSLDAAKLRDMMEGSRSTEGAAGRAELYREFGHSQSLKGVTFKKTHWSMYMGEENVTLWMIDRGSSSTAFGNMPSTLAKGETKEQAIEAFRKVYSKLGEKKEKGKKAVRFDIYQNRSTKEIYIAKKIGRDVVPVKRNMGSVKEAREYIASHQEDLEAALEKIKFIPNHRKETNAPRVGADHRNGGDVSPAEFEEAFGFRGVQFGNYVEQGRRQADLNRAYDALLDLAGILNIPPRALSLNGELGLAFGARGKGGKRAPAAHYESDLIVINLTKREGAGTLAHEWFHSLDNYFNRERGGKPSGNFATEGRASASTRPEVAEAMRAIIKAVNTTGLKQRSKALDKVRTKAYWSTEREMAARAFESYVIEKLKDHGASNDYLANIVSQDYWDAAAALGVEASNSYPYVEAAEFPVIRAAFDNLFQVIESRETDLGDGRTGVELFSRGGQAVNTHTPDTLRTAMQSAFKGVGKALEDGGLLRVITSDQIPASLTGAQFSRAQEKTPEFKRWFGDSKVVDENGKPLVVYHGTTRSFDEFDPQSSSSEGGEGTFFFASSPHTAGTYATPHAQGGNIVPAYLALENPLITGVDGEPGPAATMDDWREFVRKVERFNRDIDWEKRSYFEREIQRAKDEGRDGVIFQYIEDDQIDVGKSEPTHIYIAFRPEQIKSATGNRGTFAPDNPDIRYSRGGRIQAFVKYGVVHMVADNISRDTDVKGLMMHEIGVHLTKLGRSDAEFQSILRHMETLRKSSPKVQAAFARVPKDTPAHLVAEEALGYTAEISPNMPLAKRILSWFRAKLREWGGKLKGLNRARFMKWANDLTADDLVYMAQSATRQADSIMEARQADEVGQDEAPTMASQQLQTDTPEFRRWFGDSRVVDVDELESETIDDIIHTLAERVPAFQGSEEDARAEILGLADPVVARLARVPVSSINMSPDRQVSEAAVSRYAGMPAGGPPILVDGNTLLEGGHRLSAARKRGDQNIEVVDVGPLLRADWESWIEGGDISPSDPVRSNLQQSNQALSVRDQTQTPAFRRWFGDSKVVDENGEPLVVYHGTASDFSKFDDARFGDNTRAENGELGFFFTSKPTLSDSYAEIASRGGWAGKTEGGAPVVYPVYVKVENPKRYETASTFYRDADKYKGRLNEWRAELQNQGFDGVIVRDDFEEVIIFRPEQIKSATGNIGTFDPDNPDIRYSRARHPFTLSGTSLSDSSKTGVTAQSLLARHWGEDPAASVQAAIQAAKRENLPDVVDWLKVNRDRVQAAPEGAGDVVFSRAQDDEVVGTSTVTVNGRTQTRVAYRDGRNEFIDGPLPEGDNFVPPAETLTDAEAAREEMNRRVREEHHGTWFKAKGALKRYFAPGGLLPEPVFKAKIKRDSQMGAEEMDIEFHVGGLEHAFRKDYGKPFDQRTKEEEWALADALAGRISDEIPESTRKAIEAMRQHIDTLSERYVQILESEAQQLLESLSEDRRPVVEQALLDDNTDGLRQNELQIATKLGLMRTIGGNIGEYVHRSYRAFDDPMWPRNVPSPVLNNARDYLEARYLEQNPEGSSDEAARSAQRVINDILKKGTAFDSMEAFIRETKLGHKDLSLLKRRKAIAPEIRALMGEHQDPRVNFAKTATKMSRLIHNDVFLKRVREVGMGTFLFEEGQQPEDGFTATIAAESSEAYAPLNGLRTTPEINQAFIDALGKEQLGPVFKKIVQMNGAVKFGKTVLSPTTAARNFMSAYFFTMANGHFNLRHAKKSKDSVGAYFKRRGDSFQYLKRLKQLGVIYDTPYAGEMMRLLEDTDLQDRLLNGRMGAQEALNFFQRTYQIGDDWWKVIGFENEVDLQMKHRNITREEAEVIAAERIRDTYPTYSMTGKFVNHLRRFPLAGTFVSFPAEIIRTTFNMLKYAKEDMQHSRALGMRRVTGLAAVSAFAYAAQELSKHLLDVDDEEEEAIRNQAPSWSQNSNMVFLSREDGNLKYLDVSFLDPYNYWKRPITAIMRDDVSLKDTAIQSAGEMLAPFFGTDIAFGALAEIWSNKKATGGRVYNESDTAMEQTADIANHLRKAIQPGAFANAERILKAAVGEKTTYGKEYTMADEMAALVGFRVSTLDPVTSLRFRTFEASDSLRDASSILSRVARDPNPVDDEDLRETFDRVTGIRKDIYTDLLKSIKAARKSGLDDRAIFRQLQAGGLSKRDAAILTRGQIPPRLSSKQYLMSAIRSAGDTLGPEVQKEMNRRRLQILRWERQEAQRSQQ